MTMNDYFVCPVIDNARFKTKLNKLAKKKTKKQKKKEKCLGGLYAVAEITFIRQAKMFSGHSTARVRQHFSGKPKQLFVK